MLRRVMVILLATFAASSANAFDDCGENNGSTYFSACIASKAANENLVKIDELYKKLLLEFKKSKRSDARDSLIQSQKWWVKYKEAMCDLEQSVNGGINSVSYGRCAARVTEIRLNELKELSEGDDQ